MCLINEKWIPILDGDIAGRRLFKRHYSYRKYADGREPKLFVGPGEKLVLISPKEDALFVWRKFKSMNNQSGVNCAVFRNESGILSSELILSAEYIAQIKWPHVKRFYTYVNPKKVKSRNPGFCFIKAGWNKCGITKQSRLMILEKLI